MIFKAEPNLYVKLSNKYVQRVTGLKGFCFDNKGEYTTENELLIKVLSQNFETVKNKNNTVVEVKSYNCKHCDYKTTNKGELLVHYREHKKEV